MGVQLSDFWLSDFSYENSVMRIQLWDYSYETLVMVHNLWNFGFGKLQSWETIQTNRTHCDLEHLELQNYPVLSLLNTHWSDELFIGTGVISVGVQAKHPGDLSALL